MRSIETIRQSHKKNGRCKPDYLESTIGIDAWKEGT